MHWAVDRDEIDGDSEKNKEQEYEINHQLEALREPTRYILFRKSLTDEALRDAWRFRAALKDKAGDYSAEPDEKEWKEAVREGMLVDVERDVPYYDSVVTEALLLFLDRHDPRKKISRDDVIKRIVWTAAGCYWGRPNKPWRVNRPLLDYLFDHGASVDARDKHGESLLSHLYSCGNAMLDEVEWAIKRGMSIDYSFVKDVRTMVQVKQPACIYAIEDCQKRKEILKMLLVSAPQYVEREIAFFDAVSRDEVAQVQTMLAKPWEERPDPWAVSNARNNALMIAAHNKTDKAVAIVRLLLSNMPWYVLEQKNNKGETAMDIAQKRDCRAIAVLIKKQKDSWEAEDKRRRKEQENDCFSWCSY